MSLPFVMAAPFFAAETPIEIVTQPAATNPPSGVRFAKDLNGVLTTAENLTLHLNADLGPVRVSTQEKGGPPMVRYTVHIETDARQPLAAQLLDAYVLTAKSTPSGVEIAGNLPQQLSRGANGAQFWVRFEISVPAKYGLDISTGAGDIVTGDVGGEANLQTEGGNIVTGQLLTNTAEVNERHGKHNRARGFARLQTQGGHIQVDGAAGDLTAFTAGGFINTGYIVGEANLRSGGGHIRAAGVGGKAELETEGGNITVGKAGSFVAVKTGGGQIDFGEVRGSVHAMTGGGGIRVMYVSGPMDVESNGGSICLTRVSGAVKAATGSGTITAWINPEASAASATTSSATSSAASSATSASVSLSGASQLSSNEGDIVVFLPRNLAANIEAVVERGGEHRIEADPALALQVAKSAQSTGPIRAVASLNGGGPLLRLRTTGGKIKLKYLEEEAGLWDSMMRDQKARMERDLAMIPVAERGPAWPGTEWLELQPLPPPAAHPHAKAEKPSEWSGNWVDELELRLLGAVREDGDQFQRRLVSAPRPAYPEIARKAGIEGAVRLQVRLTPDGRIEVQKLLEGDPILADAAMAAVKAWRGKPVAMSGKPISVVSTVSFEFHLR